VSNSRSLLLPVGVVPGSLKRDRALVSEGAVQPLLIVERHDVVDDSSRRIGSIRSLLAASHEFLLQGSEE
jgi:hypothetical protein